MASPTSKKDGSILIPAICQFGNSYWVRVNYQRKKFFKLIILPYPKFKIILFIHIFDLKMEKVGSVGRKIGINPQTLRSRKKWKSFKKSSYICIIVNSRLVLLVFSQFAQQI
jgi:hypothetical protein